MQHDKTTALNNAKKYAILIGEKINPLKIILYGSYANGNHNVNSDIDIAVIVENIPDNYLELAIMLNKLTRTIDNRIEPLLLEENDDRSGFLSTIISKGITLFERPVS